MFGYSNNDTALPVVSSGAKSCYHAITFGTRDDPDGHHTGIVRSVVLFVGLMYTIPFRPSRSHSFSHFVCHLTRVKDKTQIVLRRNYLVPRNGAVTEAEAKR
jgi:hypothetical protein